MKKELASGKPTPEDAKIFYNFAVNIFDEVCELLKISIEDIRS